MKTCNSFRLSILAAAALAAVVALMPAAGSADPRPHPAATTSAALDRSEGQAFSIVGHIESVDYDANVIVVRSKGESTSIAITPTTSVERDDFVGGMSDLRPGLRVRVKGTVRDGVLIAESIVVVK
jgi:hypothetical protein